LQSGVPWNTKFYISSPDNLALTSLISSALWKRVWKVKQGACISPVIISKYLDRRAAFYCKNVALPVVDSKKYETDTEMMMTWRKGNYRGIYLHVDTQILFLV
jgi:hypothetical protein